MEGLHGLIVIPVAEMLSFQGNPGGLRLVQVVVESPGALAGNPGELLQVRVIPPPPPVVPPPPPVVPPGLMPFVEEEQPNNKSSAASLMANLPSAKCRGPGRPARAGMQPVGGARQS